MRIVTVPEPVCLKHPITGEVPLLPVAEEGGKQEPSPPWTLYRYLATFVLSHAESWPGVEGMRTLKRLHAALGTGSGTAEIEDADWEKLVKVLEERHPGMFFSPVFAYQALPLLDAVCSATSATP